MAKTKWQPTAKIALVISALEEKAGGELANWKGKEARAAIWLLAKECGVKDPELTAFRNAVVESGSFLVEQANSKKKLQEFGSVPANAPDSTDEYD